jgi:hypothetical protein
MPILGSDQVEISWEAAELTAIEECNGIVLELASGELCPFGANLKRKAVVGVQIADDVTFKVPMNDTAGSDFVIMDAAYKAKTEGTFKVMYGATYYRSLEMTATKCNPIPSGGEITMVEVTLVNTGDTLTEN